MSREGKWSLAAAVAVVLAAVLFAACGSSDSDSSSSTEATSTGSTTTAQNSGGEQSQDGQDQGGSQQGGQGGSQSGSKEQSRHSSPQGTQQGGGSRSSNVAPLKVSGGGSAQFIAKGGDNSVQEFGEEGESELQEVSEIVHDFYAARGAGDWDTACSYLAKANVEQLVELVSQSPKFKDAGCSEALEAFTRPVSAAVEREITTIDAGSFRHEGERGFLIYYGLNRTVFAMPLRNEGGAWKVAALSGTAIG